MYTYVTRRRWVNAGSRVCYEKVEYRRISNIRRTLIGNNLVDHSDVVGASPIGAAPTTSSFLTYHLAAMDLAKATTRWDESDLGFDIWCGLY